MKIKKTLGGIVAGLALTVGGAGLAAGGAHAAASDAVLINDVDHVLPVHTAGSACTKATALSANPLARTRWSTVILCHPCFTNRGKIAFHYTYIRVDLTTNPGDVYTTDGYIIPGSWKTTALRMAG